MSTSVYGCRCVAARLWRALELAATVLGAGERTAPHPTAALPIRRLRELGVQAGAPCQRPGSDPKTVRGEIKSIAGQHYERWFVMRIQRRAGRVTALYARSVSTHHHPPRALPVRRYAQYATRVHTGRIVLSRALRRAHRLSDSRRGCVESARKRGRSHASTQRSVARAITA